MAGIDVGWATAIAASLKLDSSYRVHRDLRDLRTLDAGDLQRTRHASRAKNNVGAVEPQRGCDGDGMAGIDVGWATAIAASLKLDSSYRVHAALKIYNRADPWGSLPATAVYQPAKMVTAPPSSRASQRLHCLGYRAITAKAPASAVTCPAPALAHAISPRPALRHGTGCETAGHPGRCPVAAGSGHH